MLDAVDAVPPDQALTCCKCGHHQGRPPRVEPGARCAMPHPAFRPQAPLVCAQRNEISPQSLGGGSNLGLRNSWPMPLPSGPKGTAL